MDVVGTRLQTVRDLTGRIVYYTIMFVLLKSLTRFHRLALVTEWRQEYLGSEPLRAADSRSALKDFCYNNEVNHQSHLQALS